MQLCMSPSVKFKRNTRTLAGIKGDRESLKINPDFIQRPTQLKSTRNQCPPLILQDKKHNANDRGEQKPEPLLWCTMCREHLQHFRISLQVDQELLFHEVPYYFLCQPLLLLYIVPVLSVAEAAIHPHTADTHRGTKALQQARMLFPHVVYKSSLLFTLALQSNPAFSSSLPSPFVIRTSDLLADAIGFKDPVPQVVCVQFINLLWIILIY